MSTQNSQDSSVLEATATYNDGTKLISDWFFNWLQRHLHENKKASPFLKRLSLVAGVGLEPTTFGL